MIKLVMFDFDGVLVDSNEAWADVYMKSASDAGLRKKITYDDLKPHYGKPYIEFFKAAFPGVEDDKHVTEKLYSSLLNLSSAEDFPSSFKQISGVKNALSELKKHFKLALGSGNSRRMLGKFMRRLGFDGYFDLVVTGDDVDNGKPHPEMLLKAVEHFDVRPEEAVYVGDAPADVVAARNAGVKSVVVLTGALSRAEAENLNPDYIVEDVTKIREAISCMS
jgi:HAD superfamily hydrolase (TIGR01549 family)